MEKLRVRGREPTAVCLGVTDVLQSGIYLTKKKINGMGSEAEGGNVPSSGIIKLNSVLTCVRLRSLFTILCTTGVIPGAPPESHVSAIS